MVAQFGGLAGGRLHQARRKDQRINEAIITRFEAPSLVIVSTPLPTGGASNYYDAWEAA